MCPWVMNGALQIGVGRIIESCDIENTCTSHAVSLALFMYTCSDSAMRVYIYAIITGILKS